MVAHARNASNRGEGPQIPGPHQLTEFLSNRARSGLKINNDYFKKGIDM